MRTKTAKPLDMELLKEIEADLARLQEAADRGRFDMLSYLIYMALQEVGEIRRTGRSS